MSRQFHSIRIDTDKCDGRMRCMRVCPTQAIRIRDGRAVILEEKSIGCGECIRACPNGAIVPLTDELSTLLDVLGSTDGGRGWSVPRGKKKP